MAESYKKVAGQTGDKAPEDYRDINYEVTEDGPKHITTCRELQARIDTINNDIAGYTEMVEKLEERLESIKAKAEG